MNRDQAEGQWTIVKGRIREKWGKLTDDRLDQLKGKWDQIAGAIQKEYGIELEEAERQLKKMQEIKDEDLTPSR